MISLLLLLSSWNQGNAILAFRPGGTGLSPPTLSLSLSVTQKNSRRKVLDLLKLLPHAELHSVENFLFGILPIGSQESLRTLVLITDDISNLHILEDNGGLEEKRNSTNIRWTLMRVSTESLGKYQLRLDKEVERVHLLLVGLREEWNTSNK